MSKLNAFCLAAALSAGLALPVAAQDTNADTVVATVNGTEITLGQMIVLRSQLPAQYQQIDDAQLFQGILEQLIQQTALTEAYGESLSRYDTLALENSRRAYLARAEIDKVAEAAVSDGALQAAYDARFADADLGLEYHAAHILVATEEEAASIKSEIDAGADFGEMAKQHSSDGSAASGGDLGWFGKGMMVKPFEDAVVAAEPGSVSDPVQTQFGWHLVKLFETRNATAPSLDDMREELTVELQESAIEAHITALTDAATITRADEGIDPALLRDQTLLDQ